MEFHAPLLRSHLLGVELDEAPRSILQGVGTGPSWGATTPKPRLAEFESRFETVRATVLIRKWNQRQVYKGGSRQPAPSTNCS